MIWDAANRRLFAARDRFGIKPLYYLHQGDRLLLGSEVKSLIGAGYRPTWDCESFFSGFCTAIPPSRPLTVPGSATLPPGHYLVYEEGKLAIQRVIGTWSICPCRMPHQATIDAAKKRSRDV